MKIPENLKKSGILIFISPRFTNNQKCQHFYEKNLKKSGILIPGSQEKLLKKPEKVRKFAYKIFVATML
jgi:hypothetical protein